MPERTNDRPGRRGFLKLAARVATGAALAGGSAWLLARRGSLACPDCGCAGCGELDRCGLPPAAEARRTAEEATR